MLREEIVFRPFVKDDLVTISRIEQDATPWHWRPDQYRQSLAAGHLCRLYEWRRADERRIVAFAIVQQVLDEASLLNLCVAPRWQGQGLGRALLREVIDTCCGEGRRRLLLEVRASNGRAVALYESMGFRLDGRRRDYYPAEDGREDALLYSRDLQPRPGPESSSS